MFSKIFIKGHLMETGEDTHPSPGTPLITRFTAKGDTVMQEVLSDSKLTIKQR